MPAPKLQGRLGEGLLGWSRKDGGAPGPRWPARTRVHPGGGELGPRMPGVGSQQGVGTGPRPPGRTCRATQHTSNNRPLQPSAYPESPGRHWVCCFLKKQKIIFFTESKLFFLFLYHFSDVIFTFAPNLLVG